MSEHRTGPIVEVRHGPRRWMRALWEMLVWQLVSMRLWLSVTFAVQILTGAGFAVGIGLLRSDIPTRDALFLATGAAVVTLAQVGLILGPQLIAQQKTADTYDFLNALPVPRSATAVAWTIVTVILGLPGMITAVVVSAWRYHLTFHLGWSVVPAVLIITVTATLIGYALAHAVGNPGITQALTQVLIFVMIGFSPLYFPVERLPGWLQRLHEWLPFEPMATVIRGALAPDLVGSVGRSYAVLGGWLVAVIAINILAIGRRR